MKRKLALIMAVVMCLGVTACGGTSNSSNNAEVSNPQNDSASENASGGVTLTVVSSFGGEDGNRQNFVDFIAEYEAKTGNTVKETGSTADETWKAQVHTDFESNAEPDILFFFTGVDADAIIEKNKVVSIDEIRAEYPNYASNMNDSLMIPSTWDGKKYAVPFVGYWEAMFCNKKVLEAAGVEVPGFDYTWDQFLVDCQKIKDAGYTPIAMSTQQTPHYWFEYLVLNNGIPGKHGEVPAVVGDEAYTAWEKGLNDIKELYERGFFPANTLTATDDETFQMMALDEAAFAIDGSWKIGWFDSNTNPDDFVAVFPPARGDRKTTDYIGGISMGYYITRKAWEDESKRDACVSFIEVMTSDEATSAFANAGNVTSLNNPVIPPENVTGLLESVYAMNKAVTSINNAVQDNLPGDKRDNLFSNVKNVATGSMTSGEAIQEMMEK